MATKIGQLAQELTSQNPWWRDPGWQGKDLDLLDAANSGLSYRASVLDDLHPGSLYLLRGPRRVGKTVAVKQLVGDLIATGVPPTAVVRVAVDGWAARDLRTLTQNTALPRIPDGQRRYWLLDEVTSVSGDWPTQVKWLRDNDVEFRAATVVLTGSSAAGLTEAAGALAGRRGKAPHLDRTLLPMGFRTFANQLLPGPAPTVAPLPLTGLHTPAAADAYHELLPWLDDLVRLWEQYLSYGGYPVAVAAARAGQPVPGSFIDDLFNIVANDAFQNSRLPATTEMALLERLWQTISSFAVLSKIGDDLDIRHEVVARHIAYLRDAYLLWTCPQKDDDAWIAKDRAQDKVYAVDPLVARLAHLRNPERRDLDPTAVTEMQLGNALRRRSIEGRPAAISDHILFHVRTPARKEIDFVGEHLGGVAVEGKYTQSSWLSEAATVNASSYTGILATRNLLDTSPGTDRAWAIPAGLLAFLLDT